jgi:pimeloyl-ACP methyl ester carboxylesterase
LPDPETLGVLQHFTQAELVKVEGAGHWLQHDKPAEVIGLLKTFLAVSARPAMPAAAAALSGPSAAP